MSKEQIEEMARTLCGEKEITCRECDSCDLCEFLVETSVLYNAGYRKQSEGEWIAKDNINGRCSIAICSNCGTTKGLAVLLPIETVKRDFPYCEKCGAKMKGGAE